MDFSAYEFSSLQEGQFTLHRGLSARLEPILLLACSDEYPSPRSLQRLEHEHALRADLSAEWAARPVELVRREGRLTLVLEDPGGRPLERMLGRPMDMTQFLRIAVALAAAIGRVHAQGLIHKNLKPANILVDASSGSVRLTGFGIASRLPRERQAPGPPEEIAGTLAYMPPEQTGRMNRSVDSRSDLYACGVTLYEMITGTLPFSASDPMDWIHCHIARQPTPPSERVTGIPGAIQAIILRLLAKSAEDRYQTAAGLKADLMECLAAWEAHRRIDPFPLGARDISDRLLIPEKLYGRAAEINTLVEAFDRVVARGSAELVLVSGYAGIGKSSVVNELHKLLVPPRGLFAAGKFDQFKRDIPYATLAQAFQSLVRRMLGQDETELGRWRRALLGALGQNGQLMVNLIPELAAIIGEQPPIPELPPQEAQNRFQMVFQQFLGVFARPEHPLALFLDDLQWLDAATLQMLERLVVDPDVRHILLVGAYRDNEVGPSHPLMRTLAQICSVGGNVQEIRLGPLAPDDVGQLLADALHTEPEPVRTLAELVFGKTAGNAFFVIQFIAALAEDGLIAFDSDASAWRWDIEGIRTKGFTDNVADLMAAKLRRLADATQEALGLLACLGNASEIATLDLVSGDAKDAVHSALCQAVQTGLLHTMDGAYTFIHDRVQEAAYALIPESERAKAHLRIGRLLASRTAPQEREDKIFDIVNQLDRGAALIIAPKEREQVAELNLIAARRAKAATAYVAALQYCLAGRGLLADDGWELNYRLTFDLELNWAECEYLTGNLESAEERLSILSVRAQAIVDSAAVACVRLNLYTHLDQSDRAVVVGLDYLRQVDRQWPLHATVEDVHREYDRLWREVGDRSIEALLDLPAMTDPGLSATMDVLTALSSPAFFTDENLFRLVVGRMATLSVEHGVCDGSCLAFAWLGGVLGTYFGDYQSGGRFGRLGVDLVEKHGLDRFSARVYLVFAVHVANWTQNLSTGRAFLRRAFAAALRAGDLSYAAYSCTDLNTNLLGAGDSLAEVEREAENGLEVVRRVRFGLIIDIAITQLRLVRILRGRPPEFIDSNNARFDEGRFEQHLENDPRLVTAACYYWIRKLQACVYMGDNSSAIAAAAKAAPLLWTSPTQFELAEYHFYGAVARAAACDSSAAEERPLHREALAAHHHLLEIWAKNCPTTFVSRAALVSAEIARLNGQPMDAERLYEEAIRSAREHGFVQNEGIANELAANFYAARGFETISHAYLRNARYCYLRWGADGKVRQLEQLHPHLAAAEGDIPRATLGSMQQVDVASIVKASQALSSEIELPKLIERLMTIALENAGADRGLLILPADEDYLVQAHAQTTGDQVEVVLGQTPITRLTCPDSLLRYVVRTRESVIIGDATRPNLFSADDYLRGRQPRSILCLPLIKQGRLTGLLYLENTLTSHAFTADRVAILELLAAQAAISLENTRLYNDLQEREAKVRRLIDSNIIGIFVWDFEGRIIETNEAFLHLLGHSRDDLVAGRARWTEWTPPEWSDTTERAVAELRATGTSKAYEKEFFRKDGARVPVLIGSATFGVGRDAGVSFVLDLTERKQAEEALRQSESYLSEAQAELAHVNRLTTVGQLTASIAHEINQPLAGIASNGAAGLNWLNRKKPDLDQARDAFSRIVRDSVRASDVIRGLRALVKKSGPQLARLDIDDVIREVLALTTVELRRRGVALQTDLAAGYRPVLGDRVQLQQVLLNLIMNGVEAMRGVTGRRRELMVSSALADPGSVLVSVEDTGAGFDPAVAARIFDPFFTTKPEGLGMGLSICRSIVESHRGRLWASPRAPHGAAIRFTVPAETAQ